MSRKKRRYGAPVRWYERTRFWRWLNRVAYSSGLASGGVYAWDGSQRYSRIYWRGERCYFLWWPREKWACLLIRRHWPHWPDGNPVALGLCGRCLRCQNCQTITWEHTAGCPVADEWGYTPDDAEARP